VRKNIRKNKKKVATLYRETEMETRGGGRGAAPAMLAA
jgi:hypothetical protein